MKKTFQFAAIVAFTFLFTFNCSAQIKKGTLGLHFFYSDFATAQQIKSTSLKNVLDNKLWTKLHNMQDGLAITYRKGITRKIDLAATTEFSYIDYLFKSGLYNGSTEFLLATQVTGIIKMLPDHKPVVPYLTAGIGGSVYQQKIGAYIPVGVGIQFNFFKETFLYTDFQYRKAINNQVNDHFNYSIGIASTLRTKKEIIIKKEIPILKDTVFVEKIITKNIVVKVTDEATGLVLPGVEVKLNTNGNKLLSAMTDEKGNVVFAGTEEGSYEISGVLHDVATNSQTLTKNSFNVASPELNLLLVHNDPRFTLQGEVLNSSTDLPESGVEITVKNTTDLSVNKLINDATSGNFSVQLGSGIDFTIVGKKASYISNIATVSTKGLNRSTTLYLQLKLQVEEVSTAKNIVLNNVFFETGKTTFDMSASSDLQKLVQFLNDNPTIKLEIDGHTDNVGKPTANKILSEKRAKSIVYYLIQNGIDSERLLAKGFGDTMPLQTNASAQGREKNRRVEMKLIE